MKATKPERNVKQAQKFFRKDRGWLQRVRLWLRARSLPWRARRQRQLRLCENLALGERRFLSVVECGQQRFLVGGSANSVAVLAELEGQAARAPANDGEEVPTYKFVGGELTKDGVCG